MLVKAVAESGLCNSLYVVRCLARLWDHNVPHWTSLCLHRDLTELGATARLDIPAKPISNSNLAKSRLPIPSISAARSYGNFAQSTAVSLPCTVQYFQTIKQLLTSLWANEISWDIFLRCFFHGNRALQLPPFCNLNALVPLTKHVNFFSVVAFFHHL